MPILERIERPFGKIHTRIAEPVYDLTALRGLSTALGFTDTEGTLLTAGWQSAIEEYTDATELGQPVKFGQIMDRVMTEALKSEDSGRQSNEYILGAALGIYQALRGDKENWA